ncbi:MAG: ammonia-forming cytochrome c nitrite reductase subunit c552 [Chloroflexi bacterium]|nr:ammonia-forming cytochrome c nitrite reductase subunit c552 [Chloroflexota bacterium]
MIVALGVAFVLVSVAERQQEARQLTYNRLVEIPQGEPDPAVWGRNFPQQYEDWLRTLQTSTFDDYSKYGRYGGSEAFSRLDKYPDYRKIFAGNAFAVEYNEDRGHANALNDMLAIKRLGDQKPGACMTCKSPQVPQFMQQFGTDQFYSTPVKDLVEKHGFKHSVSCADCHDATTMQLKLTRPAFVEAMSSRGIDVSKASRQEMRSYVCAQCHVEYYFSGPNKAVAFPWKNGLNIEAIEKYYDDINFSDWSHAESKAPLVKAQHPEFELYSTSVHARSGVACADCHMPYTRVGAAKVSSHWVNTPLAHVNTSCTTCHGQQSEETMKQRVYAIQDRTFSSLGHAEKAIVAAIDAIKAAADAGVPDEKLTEARSLHRKAHLRWDFISAENSMGFHSPQEAVRILGDATDYARQAELSAYKAMIEQTQRASTR